MQSLLGLSKQLNVAGTDAIQLLEIESNQSIKLDCSAAELVKTITNKGDEEIIKTENQFKIDLMLQHSVGLHINEVKSNKSITSDNRFINLFIQEGIEIEFIEKGDIIFTYVPKLNVGDPKSINDIESFYVLFSHEENHEHNNLLKERLIKIEKEKLPDGGGKECICALIEKCSVVKPIQENLQEQSDETIKLKMFTTTTRHIIVEGQYVMKNDDQRRTILNYVLKSSPNIDDMQNVFNITEQGSFILVVRNPKLNNSSQIDPNKSEKVELLQKVQKMFGSYLWSPPIFIQFILAQPEMLDITGRKLIWIHSSIDDFEALLHQRGDEIKESYAEMTTADVIKYSE
ncbi:unnamed protein product [Rotaria magnacalcarata]|uniref:Uncharacterized protein n=2 Tax=Rotaria magnacalcarata TaxID=392030 RepID=A0A815XF78_9BILA|nr:unnamed protein product [Rotaria magnacalcarata]CAF2156842.1 unnamed protein product [Rotaria magnacalcarata]CAF3800139.1 unnamed protein product [Rotaria magnacalcarata]CAF4314578.1 unnamed protein product [Rotaria magnacalcarata]